MGTFNSSKTVPYVVEDLTAGALTLTRARHAHVSG